jgi:hypothetical protein
MRVGAILANVPTEGLSGAVPAGVNRAVYEWDKHAYVDGPAGAR